ncbi:MAG: GTPase Era [Acidobacteriaceae bacterium]|nr:GTPase Era [Acidobacteriaceae bacterium]
MSGEAHCAGFVSITGRPNAGKSTLLNALVGEKVAITAHQPQTTRSAIKGVVTTPAAQIVFVDTPGIHKSDSLFNKRMMDTVRGALEQVDLVLYVTDAARPVTEQDEQAIGAVTKAGKVILVLNKVDLVEDKRLLLPLTETYLKIWPFADTVPVSARKRDGIEELKRVVISHLPEGPPLFPNDYLTDQPMRFIAAEIIRERILFTARQEVPHAVAVLIDQWEEGPKLVKIAATIHVERPGQKVILIGAKGQTLKKIGSEARQELERRLERKVFLSLFVKVKPDWREDPSFLHAVDWRSMLGSEDK